MFQDRADAGQRLAERVLAAEPTGEVVVLGLPRGGVVVAREVARRLDAPLDFVGVRKVGAPSNPEFAVGAIAEGDARVVDERSCRILGISAPQWEELRRVEARELRRRVREYRAGRSEPDLGGRTVILVDDGVATGATAIAACRSVRARGAARIVLAVPVAPADWRAGDLAHEADALIAVIEADRLEAVGRFYRDFRPTSDAEVIDALSGHSPPGAG